MSHQNLLEYLQTGRFSDAETACSQWLEIHPLDHRASGIGVGWRD